MRLSRCFFPRLNSETESRRLRKKEKSNLVGRGKKSAGQLVGYWWVVVDVNKLVGETSEDASRPSSNLLILDVLLLYRPPVSITSCGICSLYAPTKKLSQKSTRIFNCSRPVINFVSQENEANSSHDSSTFSINFHLKKSARERSVE